MENFNWTSFQRKIAVRASMSDLYDAWTKAADIQSWFLSKAIFSDSEALPRSLQESVKAEDTYAWSWYGYDIVETGKIIESNGKDHLQFSFAGDCVVEVDFIQKGEYVIVELTQKNIPTDDQSKRNIRLGCDTGWSFFLVNLKSVFEGGIDLRNKDAELKGMLNN